MEHTHLEEHLAYLLYRMSEGDDVNDQIFLTLRVNKFTDENSEWIYEDTE